MGLFTDDDCLRSTTITRKGGVWKGDYTHQPKVNDTEMCGQACLGNSECNAWYFDGEKCYLGKLDRPVKWKRNGKKKQTAGLVGCTHPFNLFLMVMVLLGLLCGGFLLWFAFIRRCSLKLN